MDAEPQASVAASPGGFQTSSRGRIPELDGLRGLAILLVVLFHFITYSYHGPSHTALSYFTKLFGLGWSGVDLFFVLSGFLIGGILLDVRESPRYFGTFYLRRIHRILPVYYVWILFYALIFCMPLGWFPATLEVSRSHLSVAPRYVFFLQNMAYQQGHFQWVWFAVTWSLAVEEQFYLIAPPLIRFLSNSRFAILSVAAVVFCPVLRGVVFVHLA